MEKLILFSVKYTGTHFVKGALVIHPQISMPVMECTPLLLENTMPGIALKDYLNYGSTENAPYEFNLEPDATTSKNIVMEMNNLGFIVPTQRNPLYSLYQLHYFGNCYDWTHTFKTVVPVRDPLLSYISAMKRGLFEYYAYFAGFEFISGLKNAFYFPVDLWYNDRSKACTLYEFLEVTPNWSCFSYINEWKKYGSIEDEAWRSDYFLGDGYKEELNKCAEMFKNREVHEYLDIPIKILRGLKLEEFYRQLGYEELLWFE